MCGVTLWLLWGLFAPLLASLLLQDAIANIYEVYETVCVYKKHFIGNIVENLNNMERGFYV